MRSIDIYQIEDIALDVTVVNELAGLAKDILDASEVVTGVPTVIDGKAETVFACLLSRRADDADRKQLIDSLMALEIKT